MQVRIGLCNSRLKSRSLKRTRRSEKRRHESKAHISAAAAIRVRSRRGASGIGVLSLASRGFALKLALGLLAQGRLLALPVALGLFAERRADGVRRNARSVADGGTANSLALHNGKKHLSVLKFWAERTFGQSSFSHMVSGQRTVHCGFSQWTVHLAQGVYHKTREKTASVSPVPLRTASDTSGAHRLDGRPQGRSGCRIASGIQGDRTAHKPAR